VPEDSSIIEDETDMNDTCKSYVTPPKRDTAAAAPPQFRLGDPALCGSHP